MSLEGSSIIVTGGGTGIGRSIAVTAASQGARVMLVGRREAPLLETSSLIGKNVEIFVGDVADPETAGAVARHTLDKFGEIHGLVNNAGRARFFPIDAGDVTELRRSMEVNVEGPTRFIQAALPELRRNNGAVVNISSVSGVLAMPGRSFYGASKAALNSMTRSLAKELAPSVRINAILPGPVDTPIWQSAGLTDQQEESLRSSVIGSTPMGRFGESVEVARWTCALLDPDFSGWVTGALIPVDGGRTI